MSRGSLPKVSVIVPVYNVAAFIRQGARALFEQTLQDIQYIFINDCTPDNSIEVLNEVIEEYPHRKDQIKIIQHSVNKGVSGSRNSGLAASTGEFIIHCDGDDWIEPHMYEDLYREAVRGGFDITWCDYFIERRGNSILKVQDCEENAQSCIKAMLCNRNLSTYLWDKLIRRELYEAHHVVFPEGINIREDFLVLIQLFHFSSTVGRIGGAYYHYRHRADSISRNEAEFDNKLFYVDHRLKATGMIEDFLVRQEAGALYRKEIMCSKLILKRLILSNSKDIKRWINLYPETNDYIFKAPLPKIFKLMMWAASTGNVGLVTMVKALINYKSRLSQKIRG